MTIHNSQDLILLFNELFEHKEKTILLGNGEEPLYLPSDEKFPLNRIIFTRDYFASALHEIAHWCIAGEERRKCVDYGYWYYPEGRNIEQQVLFEQVEVKPQALEYLFSQSAGSSFRVSLDNLMLGQALDHGSFEKKVLARAQQYLHEGLPQRAAIFNHRLRQFYYMPRCNL